MKKYIVLFLLSIGQAQAADFTIQLIPASNSITNNHILDSSLSSAKINNFALDVEAIVNPVLASKANISSLGSLASKSSLLETDIPTLTLSKISDAGLFAYKSTLVEADIPLLSVSKIINLQNILDAKADGSLLGSLALKSSLGIDDIPSLSISKITNLQSSLDAKADTSVLGTMAYRFSIFESDVPSLPISKITNLQSLLDDKASISAIGPLALKTSLEEIDIPNLSISKITNLQSSLDDKANASSLGSLASKSSLLDSDIPSILASKISNFQAAVESIISAFLSDHHVYLSAYGSTSISLGTSEATATTIPFENLRAYSGATNNIWSNGVFTAPRQGLYRVSAKITTNSITGGFGTTGSLVMLLYKNNVAQSIATTRGNGAATSFDVSINDIVSLNAGETLKIGAWCSVSIGITATPKYNFISINSID